MDSFDKNTRSRIMAKIKGQDTRPEIIVRKYLYSHGFRYRKNVRDIIGKPDVVIKKYKIIIFVHGCFWHGHDDCRMPNSNQEYWTNKIDRNKARDKEIQLALKSAGWTVIVIWECQLKRQKRNETLERLGQLLQEIKNKI